VSTDKSKSEVIATKAPIRDLSAHQICSRCIYDGDVPKITFDEEGVCNYCRLAEQLEQEYGTGSEKGEQLFADIVQEIKAAGKGKKYDCVVGVSGGTDSSYMLFLAVSLGLRPLAVHYDNTWNSAIATENIRKITKKLQVDLHTHVVDNKESDDIFRAFFLAGVPELDGPTDIALAEVLYRAANKYGVKYILEGHSFRSEGVSPLGSFYVDGKYIDTIHKTFGKLKMKTFPNMNLYHFMKWTVVKRIRKIRPFWYIAYSKEEARPFLEKEFCWHDYGGHHLENRMSAFMHSYYLPSKFGSDQRNNSLSASARTGKISRADALHIYGTDPYIEPELIEYTKKRLGFSDEEFNRLMTLPPKCYRDYKTYKKTFETLRPLFYLLAKANLVPMSFYIKYTSKNEI
jgi:N-acetyl sugar amidotransferase